MDREQVASTYLIVIVFWLSSILTKGLMQWVRYEDIRTNDVKV